MNVNKATKVIVSSNPSVKIGRSTVCITPEQLAVLFASMSSKEQAIFFSEVAEQGGDYMESKLNIMVEHEELTKKGRLLMELIGDYSQYN